MTSLATCAIDRALHPRATIDSYEYDAYGNEFTVSGTTPNEMMYRGEQYDSDLGLYYLRARYYNPLTGRFKSRDLETGKFADPESLHKYLYADGDPVNVIDPMGREGLIDYLQAIKKVLISRPALVIVAAGTTYCMAGVVAELADKEIFESKFDAQTYDAECVAFYALGMAQLALTF